MIDKSNLRACNEHEVVSYRERGCPVCQIEGIEARPKAANKKANFGDVDLRWNLSEDTIFELVPILRDEAKELGHGPVYVSVAEVSLATIRNAAGYTDQERWFNVIGVELQHDADKLVTKNGEGEDLIEQYKAGERILSEPPENDRRLEPEEWESVIAPYADGEDGMKFEMVNEDRLRMTVTVYNGEIHSMMREEVGRVARSFGLTPYTRQKGGVFTDSIIEVSR